MADVNTDIEAALEAAASDEEVDDSSKSTETEETVVKATEGSESKGKGKGAQDRIQDLVGKTKTLEQQIEELTNTLGSRDEEIGKLVDLLEMRDNDAKVVAKINELHQSQPEFRDLIETLDKAIRGEDVELPSGDKTEDSDKEGAESDAVAKAQELLRQAQQGMEESLADQQAELILHKADLLTDRYVAELPNEYNEEDVNILRTVLVDHIDWDAIEEDPDSLTEVFADGFQSALNWYGSPKGAGASASKDESGESEDNEPVVTQDKLEKFANQEWGKLKVVETPDGKEIKPEVSDEDFVSALGQALKKQNELGIR